LDECRRYGYEAGGVGLQHRPAAYLRQLAEATDDPSNLDAWAELVEALPDDSVTSHLIAPALIRQGLAERSTAST
jgi:hypothetical protein